MAARVRHRQLREALAIVARRGAAISVEFATFKGVSAAERWYERPGERSMSDLDLLVAPGDRARVDAIAHALAPSTALDPRDLEGVRTGRLPGLNLVLEVDPAEAASAGQRVAVDLHFDLLKYGIPDRQGDEIWARTRTWQVAEGVAVRVLDPEVAIVQLLVHANRDRLRDLHDYADFARLLAREHIDWDFVHEFVAREGIDVPVYCSLDAITAGLGLPSIPHPPVEGWRPALWRRLWPEQERLAAGDPTRGERRRRRFLAVMVRGRAMEGVTAWIRGTS
jgi:hypothetical protein